MVRTLFDADREFVPGRSARGMLRRYLAEYARLGARTARFEDTVLPRLARRLELRLAELWSESRPELEFPCFSRESAARTR